MRDVNSAADLDPAARFSHAAFLAAAVLATGLVALVAFGARTWIDQPFAGFFLRADRTVAPVGRAAWTDVAAARLYGRTLVAIDGTAVHTSDDLQRRVAAKPVGSPLAYTFTDGTTLTRVTLPSRRFSPSDYSAVFGPYLGAAVSYLLLAILAAWALPAARVGRALLYLGGVAGLYMMTAADLYPPAGSLRLHVLASALLPATLLQFALAVGDVRGRFAAGALPVVWATSLAAAASMQIALGDPTETIWVQATCDAALGLTSIAAAVALTARVHVAQRGALLIGGTALLGLGVPAVVFLVAGTFGGVPQNAAAALAFLFPLGVGTALIRDEPGFLRDRSAFAPSAAAFPVSRVAPSVGSL